MGMASNDTSFKDGHEGGPGRPKGSRNKLSEEFLRVLADDFLEHGVDVIKGLREQQPGQYANVIARLMPKLMELSGPDGAALDLNWQVNVVEAYCKKCQEASAQKE